MTHECPVLQPLRLRYAALSTRDQTCWLAVICLSLSLRRKKEEVVNQHQRCCSTLCGVFSQGYNSIMHAIDAEELLTMPDRLLVRFDGTAADILFY